MLGQRRRRWPNINPSLAQCVLIAEIAIKAEQYIHVSEMDFLAFSRMVKWVVMEMWTGVKP